MPYVDRHVPTMVYGEQAAAGYWLVCISMAAKVDDTAMACVSGTTE